ncbi:unnamed protein product [Paramecium sonneborni]|uniref:PSP proline-rich domain-containing protein n=1 Tax=Paramecium sonneborni TaxID=65129 RepID=A0A8S1RA47_9CILI|nr:unnamed protein product [Paramecium sonneborni]
MKAEVTKTKLSKEDYEKFKRAERRKNNKNKKKSTKEKLEIQEELLKADEEQVVYDEDTFQEIEIDALITGKHYDNFKQVFDNFNQHAERLMMKTYEKVYETEKEKEKEQEEQQAAEQQQQQQQQQIQQQISEPNQTIQNYLQQGKKKEAKLSKKQRKQLRWLKVAELKQKVKRPDLVEFWDITSPDPNFLIQLKSVRNSVTVPRHWSQKRKYLQNKRGILKEPFQLPDYIEKTGIAKLRDPFVDRDGGKMVRQKLRERMNPKQGKLDIDYQILHDAFFKYQTKPQMTKHGEIYFEGKEEEMRAKNFCPGKMSAELRSALGCSDFQAPPWLPNMQRYGPPPSYPHMRFIGMASIFAEPSSYHTSVKQVIEDSCKKADQPGLYATFKYYDEEDLNELSQKTGLQGDAPVDKSLWGKIDEVEDEGEVEQEDEEEPEVQQRQEQQQQQQFDNQSYQFGDSDTRIPGRSISGLQTPDVDLRRNLQNDPKPLYQQLEQVQIDPTSGNQIFMTGHTYVLPKQ